MTPPGIPGVGRKHELSPTGVCEVCDMDLVELWETGVLWCPGPLKTKAQLVAAEAWGYAEVVK